MDIYKDYTVRKNYTDLNTQRKAIERAYRKGRVSLNFYNSSVMDLDQRIQDCESEIALRSVGVLGPKVANGHYITELCCICGQRGIVTFGKMDFKLLGKDREGFIYFECPNCKKHLQYDPLTGKVKTRKGILGFLFGRFS